MNRFNVLLGIMGFLCLSSITTLFSQTSSCNCDVTINPSTSNPSIPYRPWKPGLSGASYIPIRPGQTLCLAAGNYNQIRFADFEGTLDSPIIIKNCGGQVNLNTADYHTLSFENCRYMRITGTGDGNLAYGISLNGSKSGASGLVVTGLSTDIEVDHIQITKASFAGMMIKQDPTCSSNTWRDNFTMYNIKVHDNYIRDVGGEGLYIGNSFCQQGMSRSCGGQTITVYPHNILGLKIYNNIVKNTGWEAIQYGCSPDAEVFNNDIDSSGQAGVAQQCNGIQMGAGSGGRLYNNIIRNVKCSGIVAIGFVSNAKIYNNLIVNSSDGLFVDTRDSVQNNISMVIANNTLSNIVNVGMKVYDYGLNYYQTNSNGSRTLISFPKNYQPIVKNNLIVGPYFGFQILGAATQRIDSSKNYVLRTPFTSAPSYFINQKISLFSDTTAYTLRSTASIVDKGIDLATWGIIEDRLGTARPQGVTFDIGAHESIATPPSIQSLESPFLNTYQDTYSFKVYPTLSDNFINVQLPPSVKKGQLAIFDTRGKMIFKRTLNESDNSKEITLDIYDFNAGVYIVKILQEGMENTYMSKFTKL